MRGVKSGLASSGSKAPLKEFWGNYLFHIEDLPFPVKDCPMVFTQFRKACESKSRVRKVSRRGLWSDSSFLHHNTSLASVSPTPQTPTYTHSPSPSPPPSSPRPPPQPRRPPPSSPPTPSPPH